MGKVKQQLEEDMMLHPELYGPDESDYMSEEELKRQMDVNTHKKRKANESKSNQ